MDVFIVHRERHLHRVPLGSVPILSLSVSVSVNALLFLLTFSGYCLDPIKDDRKVG